MNPDAEAPPRLRSGDVRSPVSKVTVTPRWSGAINERTLERLVLLLRRCWALGVTTYDLVESPDREVARLLLVRAFPDSPSGLVVLDGAEGTDRGPVSGPRTGIGPRWGPEAVGPLPSSWGRIVEITPENPAEPASNELTATIARIRTAGPEVAVDAFSPHAARALLSLADRPLVVARYSLLEQQQRAALDWVDGGPRVVVRDPLAAGRLDGSAWASVAPSLAPPVGVRRLAEAFGEVVKLGFLTERGRRTLAQAALLFVRSHPGVLTTVVPLPSEDRLDEVIGLARAEPLGPEELARARRPATAGSAPGPGRARIR